MITDERRAAADILAWVRRPNNESVALDAKRFSVGPLGTQAAPGQPIPPDKEPPEPTED